MLITRYLIFNITKGTSKQSHCKQQKRSPKYIDCMLHYQFVFLILSKFAVRHVYLQCGRLPLKLILLTQLFMLCSLDFEENRLERNILFDLFDLLDVQIFQCLYLITDCINSALLQTCVFDLITA